MEISRTEADSEDDLLINCLGLVLADIVIETGKAQTYHWNVTGMAFSSLHLLFREIYEDHFEAQGNIAERIKVLGGQHDGKYSRQLDTSKIQECGGNINATRMVETLSNDQRFLSENLLDVAGMAQRRGDEVTRDMLARRSGVHGKFA